MLNKIVPHFAVFYQNKVNHGYDGKRKKSSLGKCIEMRDFFAGFSKYLRIIWKLRIIILKNCLFESQVTFCIKIIVINLDARGITHYLDIVYPPQNKAIKLENIFYISYQCTCVLG